MDKNWFQLVYKFMDLCLRLFEIFLKNCIGRPGCVGNEDFLLLDFPTRAWTGNPRRGMVSEWVEAPHPFPCPMPIPIQNQLKQLNSIPVD